MTDERNPVDQLVDLFVYAPIGLLYERDEVLRRLVTRGRSQVQLARVLGQLAVRRGQGQLEERLTEVFGSSGAGIAKFVTEVGELIGLAPPSPEAEPGPAAAAPRPAAGRAAAPGGPAIDDAAPGSSGPPVGTAGEQPPALPVQQRIDADVEVEVGGSEPPVPGGGAPATGTPRAGTAGEEPPVVRTAAVPRPARPSLPIAGYDQLPARQIVSLLGDLSPAQRRVIRDHELSRRRRKTILHKIELLEL